MLFFLFVILTACLANVLSCNTVVDSCHASPSPTQCLLDCIDLDTTIQWPVLQARSGFSITSNPPGSPNAFRAVTFNIQNTNPFPVSITGVDCAASSFGDSLSTSVSLFFNPSPVTSSPTINAANGWGLVGPAQSKTFAAYDSVESCLSGLSFIIPSSTTYGFSLQFGAGPASLLYRNGVNGATTTTLSDSGVNLIVSGTAGFAGDSAPSQLTFNPRDFTGSITFTYAADPTVFAVDPSSGRAGGGDEIVITVSSVPSSFRVFFGTEEATAIVRQSATTITVISPPCGSQCSQGTTTVTVSVQDTTSSKKRFVSHRAPADFTYIVAGTE